MDFQEVCFSPPGPGQCQPWHDVTPHHIPEPDIMYLLILVVGIAWIVWMVRRKK